MPKRGSEISFYTSKQNVFLLTSEKKINKVNFTSKERAAVAICKMACKEAQIRLMHGHHIFGEQRLIPAVVTSEMSMRVSSKQYCMTHQTAVLSRKKIKNVLSGTKLIVIDRK